MDRTLLEDHLASAERHIQTGDQRVVRQIALIAYLERRGHDTTKAVSLLEHFQETLTLHIQHRDRLEVELGRKPSVSMGREQAPSFQGSRR